MKRLFQITGTWRRGDELRAAGSLIDAIDSDAALGIYVRITGGQLAGFSMSSPPAVTDITTTVRLFVAQNPEEVSA